VQQSGQTFGIQLFGLVDVAHHDLGLCGVGHEREASGGFDLVDDPVPVADALKSHWRSRGIFSEKVPNCNWFVVDTNLLKKLPIGIKYGKLRIPSIYERHNRSYN